jgi:hypothetical protein
MVTLYQIRALLPIHIHDTLDPAIWDSRENGSTDHPEALDAMDMQMRVHKTLLDILRQPIRTTRVEACLNELDLVAIPLCHDASSSVCFQVSVKTQLKDFP